MHRSFNPPLRQRLRNGACITGLLTLGACASTPPLPQTSLADARSAIGNAEMAGAGQYAAMELGEARNKLAAADTAVENESMVSARRLADESRVEADLAAAMTGEAKAVAINVDMKQGNQALAEELQRNSGELK